MELSGQIRTTCPPDQLVRIMRDPAALAKLLPGGSKLDQTGDGEYTFSVAKSVGPIRLVLPGSMHLQPSGSGLDHSLTARAAHLIGGKVDLTLSLAFTADAKGTQMAYVGELTATGLAGRVLHENRGRANSSLKAALARLRDHAEAQMRRPAGGVSPV